MRIKQLLYAQELKAVAYCGQSDGYLMSWAQERIEEINDAPKIAKPRRAARQKAEKNQAA